jgi:hypothetical protein
MALADSGGAVGAVTQLLRDRLQAILQAATPALGEVTIGRPDSDQGNRPSLNLFLYEVQFDASLRNHSLDAGQVAPLWLVLRYLLTAFDTRSESDSIEAHTWLGRGMRALQDMNFLTGASAALRDSPEPLKLGFEEAGPDLLSKLMQGEGEHIRCSVGFQVRPVMIARAEEPKYSLLVGIDYTAAPPSILPHDGEDGIRIVVGPSMGPTLDALDPPSFEVGDTMELTGNDLHLSGLGARISGAALDVLERHPDRIVARVPAALGGGTELSPGSHPVTLIETLPTVPPRVRTHGMVAGGLRPRLNTATVTSAPVDPLNPALGTRHTIRLQGVLLGAPGDGVVAGMYRDGAVVRAYDAVTHAPLPATPQSDLSFDVVPRRRRVPGDPARERAAGAAEPRGDPPMSTAEPAVFTPGLAGEDALANHWLRQATLRLRREVCWRRREREAFGPGDRLADALCALPHQGERLAFFAADPTARWLGEQLKTPAPAADTPPPRGGFGWMVRELGLDDVSAFALALAVAPVFDAAAGPVIAACLADASRTHPTLGLAQKLWDAPGEVLRLADPAHPLWRHGLLQMSGTPGAGIEWDAPLATPPLVAGQLLAPGGPLPGALEPLAAPAEGAAAAPDARVVADRLRSRGARGLRIVPVLGRPGAARGEAVAAAAALAGRQACRLAVDAELRDSPAWLRSIASLAWLRGVDLFLDEYAATACCGDAQAHGPSRLGALRSVPATLFVAVDDAKQVAALPRDLLLPTLAVPALTYPQRVDCWMEALAARAAGLDGAVAECARRFRYEAETIRGAARGLCARPGPLAAADLAAACRAEVPLDVGELARRVEPRFTAGELVLPREQTEQFEEIHRAMRALAEVHHSWGTARAWNEGGISVLFAGPPGTGKTMAAEVLAARLDVPMFRIDLSQVVDKYIGETEKNLKRLFDLADVADTLLFFDEADALFGKRTEVRDAHDRYANLEISYLLERMERFKGLAILASNRRKDLDEAFLRRLRYVVEFPLPDVARRRALWRQSIPPSVDASAVDFDFLARQFPLAGGHIRSAVFNACLQSAGNGRRLAMEPVLIAVRRELEKLGRGVSAEQFGRYAPLVEPRAA